MADVECGTNFVDIDLSSSDAAEDLLSSPGTRLSCKIEQPSNDAAEAFLSSPVSLLSCKIEQLTSCDAGLLNTDSCSVQQSYAVLEQGTETLPALTDAETIASSDSYQVDIGLLPNGDLVENYRQPSTSLHSLHSDSINSHHHHLQIVSTQDMKNCEDLKHAPCYSNCECQVTTNEDLVNETNLLKKQLKEVLAREESFRAEHQALTDKLAELMLERDKCRVKFCDKTDCDDGEDDVVTLRQHVSEVRLPLTLFVYLNNCIFLPCALI